LGSRAGDPQVFKQEDPRQQKTHCKRRHVESVAMEFACVTVRRVGGRGDEGQRAVGDLGDLLEWMDTGSCPGGRHGADVGERGAFQAVSVGVEEQRVEDGEAELGEPVG